MIPFAHVDQSDFPLVKVIYTGERATEENFRAYLNDLESMYHRKELCIIVFDATDASIPLSLKYQRKQAQWMAEKADIIATYCMGAAYVIPNDIIRTMLKAIFVLQQPAAPYEIFATREAGMAWAKSRLISV